MKQDGTFLNPETGSRHCAHPVQSKRVITPSTEVIDAPAPCSSHCSGWSRSATHCLEQPFVTKCPLFLVCPCSPKKGSSENN